MPIVRGITPNAWMATRGLLGGLTGLGYYTLLRQDKSKPIDWTNAITSGLLASALIGLTKGSAEARIARFFSKWLR